MDSIDACEVNILISALTGLQGRSTCIRPAQDGIERRPPHQPLEIRPINSQSHYRINTTTKNYKPKTTMKLFNFIALSLATSSQVVASESGLRRRVAKEDYDSVGRASFEFSEEQMAGNMVKITVTNQAYQQPFGPIFIMTHNEAETPIFKVGMNATEALATLAEDGDPSMLIEKYDGSVNSGFVGAMTEGIPYFGGQSVEFLVPFDLKYPYLTIASMAINSNDCFVALNGAKLQPKAKIDAPGYDAGSEENNELCSSIPGPACADVEGNVRSGNGEGHVHVHRGFFGVGDLSASGYDWRNPMMHVEMKM